MAGPPEALGPALAALPGSEAAYGPGWALVPVPHPGRAHLAAGRGEAGEWAAAERRLLEAAARVAGVALERASHLAALEARSAEVDTLVYAVSHDLRGPLISIEGMSQLLGEEIGPDLSPDARFALERLQANVAKLGLMVNDLLELSRAARLEERPGPVPAGEVVASVLESWRGRLEAAGFRVEALAKWPTLAHDASRLAQVLGHLVANSLKFAPAPVGRLWLSWTEAGEEVVLSVADDGAGIPPDQLERVFEPFVRLDLSREGSGVGLAVVRRVVEASAAGSGPSPGRRRGRWCASPRRRPRAERAALRARSESRDSLEAL
jgi:signal transduction histidine kinase